MIREIDLPDGWHEIPGGPRVSFACPTKPLTFYVFVEAGKITEAWYKQEHLSRKDLALEELYMAKLEEYWRCLIVDLFHAKPNPWLDRYEVE